MTACCSASAIPAETWGFGRVARVSMSAMTKRGWWKAPTRFLPAGTSTPVFPPIEASIIARSVVGTWT